MKPGDNLKALYDKLYISDFDLASAAQYIAFLLKKGWHSQPWERRGSIYMQQSAFTTAAVVSYSRPFTKSHGWPAIPSEFAPYDQRSEELHAEVLKLRNQVYAHSDAKHYSIRLWNHPEFQTEIIGEPPRRLTKDDCEQLLSMVQLVRGLVKPQVSGLL